MLYSLANVLKRYPRLWRSERNYDVQIGYKQMYARNEQTKETAKSEG